MFTTLYVGWKEGLEMCGLNLTQFFVSRVCKEPQVQICPKNFVQVIVGEKNLKRLH